MTLGGLQRLSKAGRGRNFFLAQTVPFDHSIDPWWSLTVSGPPGPSSGLKAIKGKPRPNFFLAQTVPFDHSIDPWWSLTVSGPPRTLQRPRGHQRPAEAEFFLAQTVPFDHSIDPWWSLMVSGLSRPSKVAKTNFFGRRDHCTHEIYNIPLEPERAVEAREARRSCELRIEWEDDLWGMGPLGSGPRCGPEWLGQ